MNTRKVGVIGESIAANYVLNLGYTIIERNAYIRWGELDLIATKANALVFFEVKFSRGIISAEEMFTRRKRNHLHRTICAYIYKNKIYDVYSKYLGLIAINSTGYNHQIKLFMEGLY